MELERSDQEEWAGALGSSRWMTFLVDMDMLKKALHPRKPTWRTQNDGLER